VVVSLEVGRICHQIWWNCRQIWRYIQFIFFFGFSIVGCHWEFSYSHVAAHDWATWQPIISPRHLISHSVFHVTYFPCVIQMPCQPFHWSTSRPKKSKNEQLVEASCATTSSWWHHPDVNKTCVTLYAFHVCCIDDDIIFTDVDVSSTNADSSLLTRLGWPKI